MQFRKEEIKLSLFVIIYVENPQKSTTTKLLELKMHIGSSYRVIYKSIALPMINNWNVKFKKQYHLQWYLRKLNT